MNFNLQAKTDVCSVCMAESTVCMAEYTVCMAESTVCMAESTVCMAESTELFQALLYWKLATSNIIDSNVDAAVPIVD